MDKLFTRACRDAGISLHSLRHIFASRLVMSGADLRTIQTLGGWHDLSLVQRYGHLSPGHCTATIERIIVGAFHNDSQQTCFRGSRSSCRTAGKRVIMRRFYGPQRGARVAESGSLENCCPGNGTVGSIPTLSANF